MRLSIYQIDTYTTLEVRRDTCRIIFIFDIFPADFDTSINLL